MKAKSSDFDIRALLVSALLSGGISRRDIRHELTLDTNSADGRADLVLLLDEKLVAFEIKSARDKLDRLANQISAYRRTFDEVWIVADQKHIEGLKGIWTAERVMYVHGDPEPFQHPFGGALRNIGVTVAGNRHPYAESDDTAPANMIRLLWAKEAIRAADALQQNHRGTRVSALRFVKEHGCLAAIRPLVINELRSRVPNRWEESFWRRYDGERRAA